MNDRTDLDRLLDLAAGRLAGEERAALAARLATEPELAATWHDLEDVLRAGEEPVAPCDVPFERLTLTDAPPRAGWHRSWRTWAPLAVAATVLAVVGMRTWTHDARPGGAREPVRLAAIALDAAPRPSGLASEGPALPAVAADYASTGPRGLRFVEGLGDARRLARASGRPLVVFLYEPTCPLCVQLQATTFRDPALAATADPFVFAKVVASGEGADLLKAHAVGWPVFVLYGVDGAEVGTFGGTPDASTLRGALAKVAGPDLAPVAWTTVRATAHALRGAEVARDAAERDAALRRAEDLAATTPLAAAVAAAARAASAPAASAVREARDLAAAGRVDAAVARLEAAVGVERGGRFERDLVALRDRLAADRVFPAMEEAR